jgi:multiple sugar transport system permease protein
MHPRLLPHLLILPAAVFTVVFFVYPMVLVSVAAFTDAGGALTLKHFQTMFGHWKFGATLGNTLMFAALVVPIQLVVALCMAQMLTQVKAVLITLVWSGGVSAILFYALKFTIGLRPSDDAEREGLDLSEHGERAYNH